MELEVIHRLAYDTAKIGACCFCGDVGELHDEHIWPDWLSDALTWGKDVHTHVVGPREGRRRLEHAPPFERTVCVVCQDRCNGGWMSNLETRAKRPLLSMITGKSEILDQQRQALIAFWTIKTSMMFAKAEPAGCWIPDTHFDELFRGRWIAGHKGKNPWRPLRKATVMLSAYSGEEHGGFYPEKLEPTLSGPDLRVPDESKGYGVTMNIGHLVFQLFAHDVEKLDFILRPKGFADSSITIWPSQRRSLRWPPRRWLDDVGYAQLKDIFSRLEGGTLPSPP
jgi:hypothetical protein